MSGNPSSPVPRKIPQMSRHKASGQAVIRLAGRDFYLGPWGSRVALAEYDRLIAEWLAGGRAAQANASLMVNQLIASFWDYAEGYYRRLDGTPSNEIRNYRDALKHLRRLYGHTLAVDFGPLALKAVRQNMIDAGLCRTNINRHVSRLKHLFKWAVENELVPPSVYQGLQAVTGLKIGRSAAKESTPVKPVSDDIVDETLPYLSRQVAAMVQLQRLTGMRPGEVVGMRRANIQQTGQVWRYAPDVHKTQHLGHERIIFLGPQAQKLLMPFLNREANAHLFSPAEAEGERRASQHAIRRTPLSCGNVPGSNVKRVARKNLLARAIPQKVIPGQSNMPVAKRSHSQINWRQQPWSPAKKRPFARGGLE